MESFFEMNFVFRDSNLLTGHLNLDLCSITLLLVVITFKQSWHWFSGMVTFKAEGFESSLDSCILISFSFLASLSGFFDTTFSFSGAAIRRDSSLKGLIKDSPFLIGLTTAN